MALLTVGRSGDRRLFWVAAIPSVAVVVWALASAGGVLDGTPVTESITWVAGLDLSLDVRVDAFSLVMVVMVAGIGVLIHAYAARYFNPDTPHLGRLAGLLTLFAGAMLGLVTADNLLWLYACWELTSITSYLLIGWDDRDPNARSSALQALLMTGAGGLVMLVGFVLMGQAAGTYELSAIVANPPGGTTVSVALVFILIGAFTKSAQWPFSSWLPGAMVAPTPISAYLHSATMVKAGVYLVARLAPPFAHLGFWRPLLFTVGLTTMVLGGAKALQQYDLKRLLAFGTVSQLGFLMVLFGAGSPEATLAGVALIVAHALFKAPLFMVVGILDHQAHTRDLRLLGRYGPGWQGPRWAAILSGASMAGVPLLFGFIAKEAAYEAFAHPDGAGTWVVLAGIVGGSMLTFAYTARLLLGAFSTRPVAGRPVPVDGGLGGTDGRGTTEELEEAPAPTWAFWAPAGALAAITVVLGATPDLLSRLTYGAAAALNPQVEPGHLALWHGLKLPLALSALTIGVGVALAAGAGQVWRFQERLPGLPSGNSIYLGSLEALNRTAAWLAGRVQSGSLPTYVGVVLVTAVVVPGVALAGELQGTDLPAFADSSGEVGLMGLVITAAAAAAVIRRRLAAVLCLGAVGYGMSLLYVLRGAPDLALTQVGIETLGAVLFVLVLRVLPRQFDERPTTLGRVVRLTISGAVGLFVFVFALVAGASRPPSGVSDEFLARSVSEGGGSNVVNVILVDFRGFDTLGEITVLTVAALGLVALARVGVRGLTVGAPDDDAPQLPGLRAYLGDADRPGGSTPLPRSGATRSGVPGSGEGADDQQGSS
ncbi:MAG: hydrogen gas-evolving membrane-bound hydrogenase subunit E [Microthrixaceae bacterium]